MSHAPNPALSATATPSASPAAAHSEASHHSESSATRRLSAALACGVLLCGAPAWAQSTSTACDTDVLFGEPVFDGFVDEPLNDYGGEFEYEALARVQPAAVRDTAQATTSSTSMPATGPAAACVARTLGRPLSTVALQQTRAALTSQWVRQQGLRSQRAAVGTWRVFVEGAPTQHTASQTGQRTLEMNSFDLLAGADHQWTDQWAVGAHLALTHPELQWRGTPSNRASGDGVSAGVHALWSVSDQTYLSAALSAQRTRYQLQAWPFIMTAPLIDSISSQVVSQSSGVSLSAGHDLRVGTWTVAPYARVDWVQSRVSHFEGASGVHRGHSTQRTLGAQAQTQWPMSWGVLMPHARLEFNQVMRWRLQGEPEANADQYLQSLQPNPQASDRSYQQLGLGFSAVLPQGWTIYSDYDRTLGLRDVRAWRLTVGVQSAL